MEKKRILIVEDEIIIATEIEYKIKSFGYDSLGIANSLPLIEEIISHEIPDMLLMDINLNLSIDGIEIAEKIRETHNIPVVFMTSYSDEITLKRAKKANPYGYILKPYEDRNLKVTLEMAFSKFDMEMRFNESEQRYKELYQNLPIGMYKTTIDGKFLMCNQAAATMLGYESYQELQKIDLNELFQNQYFNRNEFITNIKDSGFIENFEFKWVRADDTTVYLQEDSRAVRDDSGKIIYFEGTLRDITAKKIAEKKITKLNQLFNSMHVDSATNIELIVNKLRDILYANASQYHKLDPEQNESLVVWAQSNISKDIGRKSYAAGHICYETIIKSKNRIIALPKLKTTPYYHSDSVVKKHGFNAYLGHPVVVEGRCIGALSVWYDEEKEFNSTDLQIISTLAKSLALEEARLNTREKLAESESKYRIMVDNVHDHIFQVSSNFELISYNKEFKRIMGGGIVPDFICNDVELGDIIPDYCHAIKAVLSSGEAKKIEATMTREFKQYFYETIFTPLRDEHNIITGVIGLGRDITSQRVMENVVVESEKRFRSIFGNISTLAVQGCNEQHKITYWNKASEKFYGYCAAEVMGDKIFDVLKEEQVDNSESGECIVTGKNGRKIKVSRSKVTISNLYGKPEYYSLDMDLTDITKTRDALSVSEKQFQNLTSISPMAVMLMNGDGAVEYANEKLLDICETEEENLLGDSHFNYIHPDDVLKVKQFWKDAIDRESSVDLEYRYKSASGKIIWVLAVIKPYLNTQGKVKGFLGVLADITARKITENELSTHQEHVKLINKILRHDMTNNLTVINSALRIYNRTEDPKMINEAILNIKKGFELIDRMRELELYISTHNNLTMYNVMDVFKKLVKNYPCVKINVSGKGKVMADEAIYPIFDNIISNAIKHGGADEIDISVTQENGFALIKLGDNGKGIKPEIRSKIFDERFTFGKTGGSGLGLYIVKMNVERYEGEISVEENKPQGARFIVKLRLV